VTAPTFLGNAEREDTKEQDMIGRLSGRRAQAGRGTLAACWYADDVAGQTYWTVELTGEEIAELDQALVTAKRSNQPLLSVRRADFPLPTLGSKIARIAASVDRQPGFCRLRGVPVHRYTDADLRLVHWGLGRHLGVPVPQDATGHLLRPADASRVDVHSGGSDVTALLVGGGERTVSLVSTGAVYNEVLLRRPDLALRLFDTFHSDRSCEQTSGERSHRPVSLGCWSEGRLSLRYDRRDIAQGQCHGGVPPLTRADVELFDLIDEVAASPILRHDVRLATGDLLLVNNYDVLHGLWTESPSDDGRLLRLWLTLRGGRALPPTFTWPTPTYGDTGGRGGVTPCDAVHRPHRRPEALAAAR
jgi:hypothetical protein